MFVRMPTAFSLLTTFRKLEFKEIRKTKDLFFATTCSLAELLARSGVHTFPDDQGEERRCDLFFDDWYLYAVIHGRDCAYGLFKMREQEFDRQGNEPSDGDSPGVTVSFIAFDSGKLLDCINRPTQENRRALNREINRVVAARGQRHHALLRDYFKNPQSEGPYLIAEMYVQFLSSLAQNGAVPVPERYAAICAAGRKKRLPAFMAQNNRQAGYTVCDGERIYVQSAGQLTHYEQCALLAAHTANTSFHSFAAEVRYHACFLSNTVRLILPRVYESAIRADMTIDEKEFEGPTPYHNPRSKWLRQQQKYHA